MLLGKIADDVIISGKVSHVDKLLLVLNERFLFGFVMYGPKILQVDGVNVTHNTSLKCSPIAEDKLSELESYSSTYLRCRRVTKTLNEIECGFVYINQILHRLLWSRRFRIFRILFFSFAANSTTSHFRHPSFASLHIT